VDGVTGGDQAERFAQALESQPVDGPDLDLELDLAIVAALRELGPDLAPDDVAKQRMRNRVLAEGSPAVDCRRGRFAIALVAALALVFALAGMSLLLSRDALPGDALYGVKRTAEAASLGLTFGDASKALKHLELAAARVSEMETLAQRHIEPADGPVGGYLTALTDFDADAAQGSHQLTSLATHGDVQLLASLKAWAEQQHTRLTALEPRLPVAAHNREDGSKALLAKIANRAAALLARIDCYQITTGSSDDIGPLPATDVCHRPTAGDIAPAPAPSAGSGSTSAPHVKPSAPQAPQTPPPGAPVDSQSTQPPVTLPQVPLVPTPVPTSPNRPPAPPAPQLPIPILEIPPLLSGLPAIRIG
jgi:hypothetical protein